MKSDEGLGFLKSVTNAVTPYENISKQAVCLCVCVCVLFIIYLMCLYHLFLPNRKLKAAYISLLSSIFSTQEPCDIGYAESVTEERSPREFPWHEWGFKLGSPKY